MKGKTLLSLAIVATMILAALPIVAVKAVTDPTIEVCFEDGSHEISYAPCTNFTVDIKIFDTPAITQYIIRNITWDPTKLELKTGTEEDIVQGTFLGGTFLVSLGIESDRIAEVTEARVSGTRSGSGLLFQVLFHCLAPGDTTIHLEFAVLLNGLVIVPSSTVDALVHQVAPPATPPTAKIKEPLDGSTIFVCSYVTLDGSTSVDGWDTMGTLNPDGHACPITDWMWTLTFPNATVVVLHDEIIVDAFHCDGPGDVTITLTVTAPDWDLPSAPTYVDHNSKTITIHQVIKPVGPAIDVITQKGPFPLGSTPNNNPIGVSDAFGPQEEVCQIAKVTYNDEPVEYKPVSFEKIDPHGIPREFRVAFTNASGIAMVCFRIPWEGSSAEDLFGNWTIFASVDVAQVVVTDSVIFEFGYIISIRDITVTGSPLYKGDTMTIDVDLKSISMVAHDVLLTIVACDECGVPIGLTADFITVAAYDGWSAGHTITIPSWAFVGTGTIYVNVFTDYPSLGGVPYCPEQTAIFTILATP